MAVVVWRRMGRWACTDAMEGRRIEWYQKDCTVRLDDITTELRCISVLGSRALPRSSHLVSN